MAKRILIADDEPHIRRVVEMKLAGAGYEVKAVTDGAMAVDTAKAYLPHLVVSDYKMPGEMTGVDVIVELRQETATLNTPIILLTGSVAVSQRLARELSAVSNVTLIQKPFSPRQLVTQVKALLGEE